MKAIIIAFTFLFGILSFAPNMQGGQFFKLSEVVEHYNSHQDSEEQFQSFLDFVKDHYFKNHDTKDNERNLPFKSTVASTFVLVMHQVKLEPIHEYLFIVNEEKTSLVNQLHSYNKSPFPSGIHHKKHNEHKIC